jgi:hypothetical protein
MLLVQDRILFQTNIEDWKTRTTAAMKQWLVISNTPFIRNALQLAKSQLKQNTSDIRQFMPNAPITAMCSKTTKKQ